MSLLDDHHPLLEPAPPAYSPATVRRAFIVWLSCGQTNHFHHVCNYYHYLEAMEEKLPADKRAASRQHEFKLFKKRPPTSSFLNKNFPKLYSHHPSHPQLLKHFEATGTPITNLENETKEQTTPRASEETGTSTEEILATSQMIRNHCQTNMISLQRFMEDFKKYATKCELKYTVNNVAFYIKRQMVRDELQLVANCPKNFDFLSSKEELVKNINNVEVCGKEKIFKDDDKENVKEKPKKRAISKSHEFLNHASYAVPFGVKNVNSMKSFQVLKSDGSLSKSISYGDVSNRNKNFDLKLAYQTLNNKVDKNHNIW